LACVPNCDDLLRLSNGLAFGLGALGMLSSVIGSPGGCFALAMSRVV
jgi:uncharacterized membrane protein YdjX (TVP38/TMEM64 family)